MAEALRRQDLWPQALPGEKTRQTVRDVLGFAHGPAVPIDGRVDDVWERDGLRNEAVSWSVGYGPRTAAVVVRPADESAPLPGVVALHSHDDFTLYGKEKIVDGREASSSEVLRLRDQIYGGRAFASELARHGFAVLVHDGFLWGSRRFPLDSVPSSLLETAERIVGHDPTETAFVNAVGNLHEQVVERYCLLLGTTIAGVASHEDRVATTYLRSRDDVLASQVGCIGLSGGGCRAALLQATCDDIQATVIVGMMSTYQALLDHRLEPHTWMLFPPGLSRVADWPDVAASGAPSPLLVQYCRDDELFPLEGMEAADARIRALYAAAGDETAYTGTFHEGPHRFDVAMQAVAFEWLAHRLRSTPAGGQNERRNDTKHAP